MDNSKITLSIEQLEARIKTALTGIPTIAGNEVVNFALDNFKNQGFIGEQPWRPRKDPNKWGQSPKRNDRAILTDTGRLKQSIRVLRTSFDEVVIGTDVPYAKTHNEGLRLGLIQSVKGFTRKYKKGIQDVKPFTRKINQNIPARPFLKDSPYLTARVQRVITAQIIKAFKQ